MKLLILCFLCVVRNIAFSQEIGERKFDKFDSVFSVVTKDKAVGSSGMQKFLDSGTYGMLLEGKNNDSLLKTEKFQNLIQNQDFLDAITKPNIFIKIGKYVVVKNRRPSKENYTAYTMITAPEAMSFDAETRLKIIYSDNSLKE